MSDDVVVVVLYGDAGCFTDPLSHVERVSYPFLTPSAALGILKAIFGKPEFWYRIIQIEILNPIQYESIVTNELNCVPSIKMIEEGFSPARYRTQRHSRILRNIAYVVRAIPQLSDEGIEKNENIIRYIKQSRRRISWGQYHAKPYFGMSDFPAEHRAADGTETPADINEDFGRILQGVIRKNGKMIPMTCRAVIKHGIFEVPQEFYDKYGRTCC